MKLKQEMICHFLASIAYRTQKSLKDAPKGFDEYRVEEFVRTPHELLLHMSGVIGYAISFFDGSNSWYKKKTTFEKEIERFHENLEKLNNYILSRELPDEVTYEKFLQGPLSDVMTHAGQLALMRRLFGSPVQGENFIMANISSKNLSSNQPPPVSPDKEPLKPRQESLEE